MGRDVKSAVIIAHKQIELSIIRSTSHRLNELVDKRRDSGVLNGNSIKGLKVMYKVQFTVLFFDNEPAGVIKASEGS